MSNCWFCNYPLEGQRQAHFKGHTVHATCLRTHARDRKVMKSILTKLNKGYAQERINA